MRLETGIVPGGSKLAAAADVGQHIHAAMLEPQPACHGRVIGRHRDLEPAVRIENGGIRPVIRHVFAMHNEVWDPRSIFRRGLLLLHHIGRCIELRLLLFGLDQRSVGRVAQHQRRRRQKAIHAQNEFVVRLARRLNAHRLVVRYRQLFPRPVPVLAARIHIGPALHMVESGHDDVVPRHVQVLLKLLRRRHKHHRRLQMHGVRHRRIQADGNHRALGKRFCLALRRPVLVQRDDQLPIHQPAQIHLQRQSQLLQAAGQQQVDLGLKKAVVQLHNLRAMALGICQHMGKNTDVFRFTVKDLVRARERLAALPLPHRDGVAGLAHGARAPVARHQQRVLVDPGDVLLAGRQLKTAGDKGARLQVELAHGDRVFASGRQLHHAQLLRRLQASQLVRHPALLVLFGQRIVVEDRLPPGLRGQVARQRGAAQNAALVIGVPPGVVHQAVAKLRRRQSFRRIENFERVRRIRGKVAVVLEHGGRARILRRNPGHRPLAVNVLQPGVVVRLLGH